MMRRFNYDTHMHLDLYRGMDDIIKYIEENQSYTIAMTNLPVLYEKYSRKYNNLKYIRFSVGLHPQLVEKFQNQIPLLIRCIEESKYIGEVGLDFSGASEANKSLQIQVFKEVINSCRRYSGKVLSIHSKKATKEINELIGVNKNCKIVMHWFTGSKSELKQAIENGYYFSINSEMIKSKKGLELIKSMPINKILLESDAPFTKDTKKNYELSFMKSIENVLAEVKRIDVNDINSELKKNFKSLFQ